MIDKQRLRGAMASVGLTQKQLAKVIGISPNTLSAKINGRSFFDTQEIDKICTTLQIYNGDEKAKIFLPLSSQNRDVILN